MKTSGLTKGLHSPRTWLVQSHSPGVANMQPHVIILHWI